MKLRLPNALLVALMAATVAPALAGTTVGDITYSGSIYTWNNTATTQADLAGGAWALSTYTDGAYSYGDDIETWDPTIKSLIANGGSSTSFNNDLNTVRFDSTKGTNGNMTYTFRPLALGGIIVETGATGYSISASNSGNGREVYLGNGNDTAAYSSINEDFTISIAAATNANDAITLQGTQTIAVASGKTFTLNSGSHETRINGTLTLNGGTLALTGTGATVINGSVTNNGTLNLGSAVTLNKALTNKGTISAASDGTTINVADLSSIGATATYSDGENGFLNTSVKLFDDSSTTKTINGTVTYTIQGQAASLNDGVLTLNSTASGVYYINSDTVDYAANDAITSYRMQEGAELNITGAATISKGIQIDANDNDGAAISVASDTTATISGAITGTGVLKKTGAGTLVLSNGNNSTTNGGVIVDAGTLQLGNQWGLGNGDNGLIQVNSGAVFDLNGKGNTCFTLTLNGGKMTSSGDGTTTGTGNKQMKAVIVSANSTDSTIEVLSGKNYGIINSGYGATSITLNNSTLTKTGAGTLYATNTTVSGGTLKIDAGTVQFNNTGKLNGVTIQLNGGSVTGGVQLTGATTLATSGQTAAGVSATVATNGKTLTLNAAESTDNLSLTGAVSGTGSITKTGSGTVTLSSMSGYTGSITSSAGTLNLTGSAVGSSQLYSNAAGTVNIGDGTSQTVASITRIELGDTSGSGVTTLNVKANSILKVTGAVNESSYKSSSLILGEWAATTTAVVDGLLLAKDAKAMSGDAGYTLTINSTGTAAVKGIGVADNKSAKSQQINVNLSGGSLLLGDVGVLYEKTAAARKLVFTSTGGTIGTYADSSSIATAMTLSSGTTTLNTNLYTVDTDANEVTEGSTASALTVGGVISGSGALKVTGAGTVTLSGANTYTGITTVAGTTLNVANADAIGSGEVRVTGTSTIAKTDTVDQVSIKGKLRVGYWNSTSDQAGNVTATLADKTSVGGNMDVVMTSTAKVKDSLSVTGTTNVGRESYLQILNASDTAIFSLEGTSTGNTGALISDGATFGYVAKNGDTAEHALIDGGSDGATVSGSIISLAEAAQLNLADVTIGALNNATQINGTETETDGDMVSTNSIVASNVTFTNATVTLGATSHSGTVSVSGTTTFNSGTTINANLNASGALTFNAKVSMGCDVTFATGTTMTLAGDSLADFNSKGNTIVFSGVDNEVSTLGNVSVTSVGGQELSLVQVGSNLMVTPEPATATLSLLALAGLCARRRRK